MRRQYNKSSQCWVLSWVLIFQTCDTVCSVHITYHEKDKTKAAQINKGKSCWYNTLVVGMCLLTGSFGVLMASSDGEGGNPWASQVTPEDTIKVAGNGTVAKSSSRLHLFGHVSIPCRMVSSWLWSLLVVDVCSKHGIKVWNVDDGSMVRSHLYDGSFMLGVECLVTTTIMRPWQTLPTMSKPSSLTIPTFSSHLLA